jgi:hypothetical protein
MNSLPPLATGAVLAANVDKEMHSPQPILNQFSFPLDITQRRKCEAAKENLLMFLPQYTSLSLYKLHNDQMP